MAVDWGIGRYEETGKALEPVAVTVVERAAVRPGECALDLGCGSGNAALALARAGAAVTAVDPSARLLEVTRSRAIDAGVTVDARQGEGAAIPLDDGSTDLIVSVFAVIFSPDPAATVAEMRRVLAPGGRILLTAWVPGIGIGRAYAALGAAMAQATGTPPPPPPSFSWHDPDSLSAVASPYGLSVSIEELPIAFTAESPEAQVELDATTHPMWIDNIAKLTESGVSDEGLRAAALTALRDVNEDPVRFRTTSRYVIATLS
ncbi:MAG TPA: class I SAM-dependent methyltransferase [Mycobacteriales bacterium]|nr:class I SAM-dependent methyltransferase [Mycobacteriales bacterium]